jgi:hypothetical protein
MAKFLKLALWNANGLTQHTGELTACYSQRRTSLKKSYPKLPNYTVYHTNHPAGNARDGTAIIIKYSNKHPSSQDFLQATRVSAKDSVSLLTISAVYLPPKHTVKQEQLKDFYSSLGRRFIAGGDYNAKHTDWGSRLITPGGREVLKTMERNNLKHLSTGEHMPVGQESNPGLSCIREC